MENFRDDELKKWLAEEYEKEIDEMEKVLFPDGVLPDDGETEEEAKAAYQRLVERLKADGIYEEDETDSNEADEHRENVKIVYLPEKKRHKAARVAVAVLVCAAGVFAASMTSQANRSYFIDSVRYWVGDDTKIAIENDEENEKADMKEVDALGKIKDTFDIIVPQFMYRPSNFKFKNYKINKEMGYAYVEYLYNDTVLLLQIDENLNNQNSRAYSVDGKKIEKIKFKDENIEIEMLQVKAKQDEHESYIAYWEKDNFFYEITGKMEKNEFIKLIENISF